MQVSSGAARTTLLSVILALVVLFYFKGRWLPSVVEIGTLACILAAGVFVWLLSLRLTRLKAALRWRLASHNGGRQAPGHQAMTLDTPETDAPENPRLTWNAVAVRVAVFVACAALGRWLPRWLPVQGTLGRSVLFTFSAGILANAIPARIFERARFADFGLGWTKGWAKGSRTARRGNC